MMRSGCKLGVEGWFRLQARLPAWTRTGGRTGWAVQSLTTLHGAVLAAGQQGRGEADGHGL